MRSKRGALVTCLAGDRPTDSLQTIPNHGSRLNTIAEGGEGLPRLVARYVTWRLEGGQVLTVLAMTASQMRIAETIDAFYGDAGAKDGVSRSYKQAVEDLDAETIKALDGPYR